MKHLASSRRLVCCGLLAVGATLVDGASVCGAAEGAAAGVRWTVPARWTEDPARPMRVATYQIPAARGDAESAECGVFYFGAGQGGAVDANLDRWVAQFEGAGKPARTTRKVGSLEVSQVQLAGTYLSGGPMVAAPQRKANFQLLGAIVTAPQGAVFFKLTGPAATVKAAEAEFNTLIGSLKRH